LRIGQPQQKTLLAHIVYDVTNENLHSGENQSFHKNTTFAYEMPARRAQRSKQSERGKNQRGHHKFTIHTQLLFLSKKTRRLQYIVTTTKATSVKHRPPLPTPLLRLPVHHEDRSAPPPKRGTSSAPPLNPRASAQRYWTGGYPSPSHGKGHTLTAQEGAGFSMFCWGVQTLSV